MAKKALTTILLVILRSMNTTSGQKLELFYSFDFNSSSDWNLVLMGNPKFTPSDNCNSKFSSPYCLTLHGDAYISRIIPTTGYHSIRVQFDIDTEGLDTGEYCYVYYRSSSTSVWIDGYTLHNNTNPLLAESFNVTHNFDNQSSFELQIGINASGSEDLCYYDNLKLFGITIESYTNANPTVPHIAIPTTGPSKGPTTVHWPSTIILSRADQAYTPTTTSM